MQQQFVINILLIISALIGLIAAVIVYWADRKSWENRFLTLILISGALWAASIFFTIQTGSITIGNLAFFSTFLMIVFANSYMIANTNGNRRQKILWIFIPGVIFAGLTLIDSLISKAIDVSQGFIRMTEPGLLYPVFIAFTVIYLLLYIYFSYLAYKQNQGTKQLQVLYIIIGTIIIAFFGFIFDLLLPLFEIYNLNNLGPIFGVFMATGIAYAATKHYIYDRQVVFSEIWTFILILLSIIWLLTNLTLFNYFLFFLVLSICILFIRAIISEADKKYILGLQKEQLQKDKEELQKLDRLKDEFLQMASHELNSPLAVIEGKLSMIVVENIGDFSADQREYLKPIFKDSQRLAQLSSALIEVIDIDQKKIVINKAPTDIKSLVKEAVEKYIPLAQEKGLTLKINWPTETLPLTNIDKDKIKQVLTYLIDNAVKFTFHGEINLDFKIEDNNLQVSVKDTGIGIAEEDQTHIFEKFYQAGRFDKRPREQQGAGLHLYIAKNLIELHGGKIWVESVPGQGSTFSLSLPC